MLYLDESPKQNYYDVMDKVSRHFDVMIKIKSKHLRRIKLCEK